MLVSRIFSRDPKTAEPRQIGSVVCPNCGAEEEDVYYAPTCGFTTHRCLGCGTEIDLEQYTGITYEQASNKGIIEAISGERLSMMKDTGYISEVGWRYSEDDFGCRWYAHVCEENQLPVMAVSDNEMGVFCPRCDTKLLPLEKLALAGGLANILSGEALHKDVTDSVEVYYNDEECLPVLKCVCGAKYETWEFVINVYPDMARACPACSRKMFFTVDIKVYEIQTEQISSKAIIGKDPT